MALTQGDACGIGPEVIAKLFGTPEATGCFVVGDVAVMRRAAAWVGGLLTVARIDSPADAWATPPRCIPVWQPQGLPALCELPPGRIDARAGAAAAQCIREAVAMARRDEVAGIVTAPIHKEALAAAGVDFPGHTEMLQALAADPPPAVRMMLANQELRTVLVTIPCRCVAPLTPSRMTPCSTPCASRMLLRPDGASRRRASPWRG